MTKRGLGVVTAIAILVTIVAQGCTFEVPAPTTSIATPTPTPTPTPGKTDHSTVTVACPSNQKACADGCFDVSRTDDHCGESCTKCINGQTCVQGTCTCSVGTQACTNPPGCYEVSKDPNHCGATCTPCGFGFACTNGACSCPSANTCADGCFDTQTDLKHCGSCTKACVDNEICAGGTCTCKTAQHLCDGDTKCYPDADTAHCGSTCAVCNAGQTCSGGGASGVCTCDAGKHLCSLDKQCYTDDDATHCGASCQACKTNEVCSAGACTCNAPAKLCSGACVNTDSDPANCGACGHSCSTPRFPNGTCTAGRCNMPSAQNGAALTMAIAVDPGAAAPSHIYMAARTGFGGGTYAALFDMPIFTNAPLSAGTQIDFPNSTLAAGSDGNGIIAYTSLFTSSPLRTGFWNNALNVGATQPGGALRIRMNNAANTAYFTQNSGDGCIHLASTASAAEYATVGCARPNGENPAITDFVLAPNENNIYAITRDGRLDAIGPLNFNPSRVMKNTMGAPYTPNNMNPGVALTGQYVFYLTTQGEVRRFNLADSSDDVFFKIGGNVPVAVLADATYVYFVYETPTNVSVYYAKPTDQVPVAGTMLADPLTKIQQQNTASFIQSPNALFFVLENLSANPPSGVVFRAAKP